MAGRETPQLLGGQRSEAAGQCSVGTGSSPETILTPPGRQREQCKRPTARKSRGKGAGEAGGEVVGPGIPLYGGRGEVALCAGRGFQGRWAAA